MEIKFCHRCGTPVTKLNEIAYKCQNGHNLFYDASPTAALCLLNDKNEILMTVRAREPGKGLITTPGGYCDFQENFETALAREVQEEIGLQPSDYTTPQYLLSYAGDYEWEGNITHLLNCFFWARLKGNPKIIVGDDAADYVWYALNEVPHERLAFPGQAHCFEKLQEIAKR